MAIDISEALFKAIDERRDELVDLTRQLIGFPTVNPPGEAYRPCAEFIGRRLAQRGFTVDYVRAAGTPQHAVLAALSYLGDHPAVSLLLNQCTASVPANYYYGYPEQPPAK